MKRPTVLMYLHQKRRTFGRNLLNVQQFLCIYIEKGGHLVEFYEMSSSFYVFTSKKEDIWSKLLSFHIKIVSVDEMTDSFDVFTLKKEDIWSKLLSLHIKTKTA